MTAIIGAIDNGTVWMGADSAGVAGLSLTVRADPKLFLLGDFLIGFTSSFRMGQVLRYYLNPPTPREKQDGHAYMVTQFVPEVRTVLKAHGYLRTKDGAEGIGTFLVGWRGRLYSVETDMQVGELKGTYAACGCGSDLLLGSMHTTEQLEGLTIRDRLQFALEAAEAFSAGVRGPFVILRCREAMK